MVRHVDKGNICVHVQTEIHGSLFILDIFTYEHHKGSNSRLNEYTTASLSHDASGFLLFRHQS